MGGHGRQSHHKCCRGAWFRSWPNLQFWFGVSRCYLLFLFFSEYLKLSYIRTRYTVEFSPIVIFGLSHYNMCQFSTRSDSMKDRRQRTHNHFKFSTLKYQKYLKSWIIKGQISAQPHTIVKQICFPNGNVLFSHCFLCPRTERII